MSQNDEEWKKPRNPLKQRGNRKMDVDAAVGVSGSRYVARLNDDDDDEEIQCQECNAGFHQRWRQNSMRGMVST